MRGLDVRCATDAEDVELSLVQAHVPKSQTSEETGEQDENRNKDSEDNKPSLVFPLCLRFPLHERVHVACGILAGVASELAEAMCGEREQGVS